MAIVGASSTGNWSSASVFPVAPQAGDTVVANGFTVTIDQDINVAEIRTLAADIYASGGGFTVSGTRTLTCNVLAGTTNCLTINGAATLTINGNCTGSAATSARHGVTDSASAYTLTINGNLTGGGNTNARGANFGVAGCTININGNIAPGTSSGAEGIRAAAGTCTITVVGGITGGSAVAMFFGGVGSTLDVTGNVSTTGAGEGIETSGGTVDITGDVTGSTTSSAGYGVLLNAAGNVTITGTITPLVGAAVACNGSSSTATLVINGNFSGSISGGAPAIDLTALTSGTPAITVNGNVTAGTVDAGSYGIEGDSSAGMTVAINGNVAATSTANGIFSQGPSTVTVTGSVTAVGSKHGVRLENATTARLNARGNMISSSTGYPAYGGYGVVAIKQPTTTVEHQYATDDEAGGLGALRTLSTNTGGGSAAVVPSFGGMVSRRV